MLPWLSSHDAKRKPQSSMQALAEVTLDFEPGAYRVQAAGAASGDVALSWVHGTLRVNSASADAELAALGRWRIFLRLAAPAFFYVCLDLLWRLCRNVERGEVFSESNTRLVRNLGLVILLYQAVACAAARAR